MIEKDADVPHPNNIRVTVITIAWNDLGGLKRTVESVRAQTWRDIQHVVVDGASTDGTSEWLATLDRRTTWRSEPDSGRYDAMNKGIRDATGDLLWFMNSGDCFHAQDSVASVVAAYKRGGFGWAYGLSNIVADGRTRAIGGRIPFVHSRFLLGGRVIPHQATIFAADLVRELGGYDTNFGLAADQLFMARASLIAAPEIVPQVLCDFDASGAGSTRSAWHHYKDMHRTRLILGVTLTGSHVADRVLSLALWVGTVVQRVERRVVSRLRVQTKRVADRI